MEQKNSIISAVRGIAIILVVYGHVIQRTMAPQGEDFFLNPAFKTIYSFHMPLFFFMSGYLMAFTLSRRTLKEALVSRFKSLFIPFVTWAILALSMMKFFDHIEQKTSYAGHGLLEDLIINPSLWFLFTLFMVSVLCAFSVFLERKWGLTAFVAVYVALMLIPYNKYGALYYIQWFYPFYLAGYFLKRQRVIIPLYLQKWPAVVIVLTLFALAVSYGGKGDYIYIHQMSFPSGVFLKEAAALFYRYVVAFLGIALVFYIGRYLSATKAYPFLETIGLFSLDIYLIQSYIVEGLYPRWVASVSMPFDRNGPLFMFVLAPLLALFFIGLCWWLSRTFIRKNRLLNILLLGSRTS